MEVKGNNEEIEKLSQELFNKSANAIKYLMITNYVHTALIENESCLRTGLYSWLPTFDGNVKNFADITPEEIRQQDIVQVNLAGQDVHLLGEIRKILDESNPNKTKIVANNDYTVELWANSFEFLPTLRREIDFADVIFGTEPNQVGSMEVLLKRKVHLIVHPCFTKRLKTLKVKRKFDVISNVSHRYDNYNIIPSLAIKDLGCKTRLIGYDPKTDRKNFVTSTCYNIVLEGASYPDFCKQLQESKIVMDLFTLTSQSRVGWDCAALGVPLVGSDRCYSHQVCYPHTMVPPFDIRAARNMVKKLLNDEEFRNMVIEYAKKAVDYVSYENSKLKYLKALKEGSQKVEI